MQGNIRPLPAILHFRGPPCLCTVAARIVSTLARISPIRAGVFWSSE